MLAFAAGVVSFASPCVLPLVPGYILMVTGSGAVAQGASSGSPAQGAGGGVATATAEGEERSTRAILLPILLFILGFSIVFTLLGGFAGSTLSAWLRSDAGQRAAGIVVAVFGLFMLLYAFRTRITWLYREERPLLSHVRPGPAGALPLGMAFAVGWTPCIGPVLAAILTLAAAQQSAGRAAFLLFMYSVGLGIPFVLVGLGVTRLMGAFRFVSRNYRWFAGVSGVLLIVLGVLLMTGLWTTLLSPVLNDVNRFTPPI
jgi:cytochrome c-type biogenesis protein